MSGQSPQRAASVTRRGADLVVFDADGREWRVHDFMRLSGSLLHLHEGSSAAELRVFAASDREPLVYAFDPPDARDGDGAILRSFRCAVTLAAIAEEDRTAIRNVFTKVRRSPGAQPPA